MKAIRDNDAVRVGYIDKKRGYISGLSVFEANKYAEKILALLSSLRIEKRLDI